MSEARTPHAHAATVPLALLALAAFLFVHSAPARASTGVAGGTPGSPAAVAKREPASRSGPGRKMADARSGVRWVAIPVGTFTMGCTAGDGGCGERERPAHAVTLTKPYDLAESETTVEQYGAYLSATGASRPASPGFPQGADHPVVNVSWNDAVAFCSWAGGRLPTEAEWERAARGGEEGKRFPWASTITRDEANYGRDECCGGATGGRDRWMQTSPAKSFGANGFGLYDMSGNVWEWVADWYGEGYYGRSPPKDPEGPATGERRVLRGGSWVNDPWRLRVSDRFRVAPELRGGTLGFRCARDEDP